MFDLKGARYQVLGVDLWVGICPWRLGGDDRGNANGIPRTCIQESINENSRFNKKSVGQV